MMRNQLDGKLLDYTWKQNRLSKDKEALKNSVLNVIRKKQTEKKELVESNGNLTPQPYATGA